MSGRRNGPGFFAADRATWRLLLDEAGDGELVGFFTMLAIDARDGVVADGNHRDLAAYFHLPVKRVERFLLALCELGWIEWDRPKNQSAEGRIVVVKDVERMHRPDAAAPADDPRLDPRLDPASTPASPTPTPVGGEATRGNAPHQEPGTGNQEPEPQPPPRAPADAPAREPGREVVVVVKREWDSLMEQGLIDRALDIAYAASNGVRNATAWRAKVRGDLVALAARWSSEHDVTGMPLEQVARRLAGGEWRDFTAGTGRTTMPGRGGIERALATLRERREADAPAEVASLARPPGDVIDVGEVAS